MTSQRARAYGRVIGTIEDLGPAKLLPTECERIRAAADALLFCEDLRADDGAADALADMRDLTDHLLATDRWAPTRAERLLEDLRACGPLMPVA